MRAGESGDIMDGANNRLCDTWEAPLTPGRDTYRWVARSSAVLPRREIILNFVPGRIYTEDEYIYIYICVCVVN